MKSEDKKLEIYYGEVIFFNPKTGYGFAQWDISGVKQKDMFIHFSDISMEGFKTLFKSQKIQFSIGANKNGDPKAINIIVLQH